MSSSNLIIRLIDIVLILLFGFLVISEIDKKSPVKLPQSDAKMKKLNYEEELLVVGIKDKSTYIIEAEDITYNNIPAVLNKIEIRRHSLDEIGRKLRVRIRSEWSLPIKYTMRIANYCRSQNIPVGMDVHTFTKKSNLNSSKQ